MTDATQRSLGELFAELSRDTGTLLRKELELAQVEMSRKLAIASRRAAYILVGAAVAYAGLLALIATLVVVLAQVGLAWWLAALIVAVAVLVVGAVLVQTGLSALRAENLAPTATLRSVRETAEWVGNRTP